LIVDYELELKADFPPKMVLEMEVGVVYKTRRMVIRRALGAKSMIKAFQDYLKLHLPASYTLVTLLTRGFFEVFFMDEKGGKSARKITTVEWSGLNLSFSRYIPNFDTSVQGVETLLSHIIKVQFLELHEQFRNTKCCNPSLGLTTKARVCKVVSQEGSWKSHNILPGM